MAATKFSVITTGENPSWHICVKELPGKHTYKIAVTVAKEQKTAAEYFYIQAQEKKVWEEVREQIVKSDVAEETAEEALTGKYSGRIRNIHFPPYFKIANVLSHSASSD